VPRLCGVDHLEEPLDFPQSRRKRKAQGESCIREFVRWVGLVGRAQHASDANPATSSGRGSRRRCPLPHGTATRVNERTPVMLPTVRCERGRIKRGGAQCR